MDIKKYQVLLDTLDKGSFAKACAEHGYTQSGITHMMNSLEKEVGFPLLLRTNKGIRPTQEGKAVLPTIRELVKLNERLEQEFNLLRGMETGQVRVGSYPTIACIWLPRIIHELRERHPGIQVEVQEENSIHRLEKNLQDGRIDLCFASRQPGQGFDWIPLSDDPYFAVLPAGHPLTRQEQVRARDLMGETFFMCKSIDGMDPDIMRYFQETGVPISSGYSCNSDNTIIFMVEQDLGVSMLPRLFLDAVLGSPREHVVTRPLTPPASRQLGLAVRSLRELSPAMKRFIRCTRDVLLRNA